MSAVQENDDSQREKTFAVDGNERYFSIGLSNEKRSVGYSREETPDDGDDEEDNKHWESVDFQDRGAFDIFGDFDDENKIEIMNLINLMLIFCLYLRFILI